MITDTKVGKDFRFVDYADANNVKFMAFRSLLALVMCENANNQSQTLAQSTLLGKPRIIDTY